MRGVLPILEGLARRSSGHFGMRSHWVDTEQGKLHIYEGIGRGHLPPITVLHGVGSNATSFLPMLIELLNCSRHVLAPDLPVHGFSERPQRLISLDELYEGLLQLFREQVREPTLLVGNSLGGGLAMRVALDLPHLVRGLVLISPAGAPFESSGGLQSFLDVFRIQSKREARELLTRLYHKKPWMTRVVEGDIVRHFDDPHMRHLLATMSEDHYLSPIEIKRIKQPILFIWGGAERLLPAAQLDYFKEHLPPDAVIEQPEAYSHCPHYEHPKHLAKRIGCFAREIVIRRRLAMYDEALTKFQLNPGS